MITCSTLVEKEIRNLLRENHGVTLPRFDLLAALDREPQGLTMGDLSKKLLVSNGNVTGIVERLQKEGLVQRQASESDRRTFRVYLTDRGQVIFQKLAKQHESWIDDLLGDLEEQDVHALSALMDKLKTSLKFKIDEGKKP